MQNSDYGQIENRKKEKWEFQRWLSYLIYTGAMLIGWFIVSNFFDAGLPLEEKQLIDYFLIQKENKTIDKWSYYFFTFPILFLMYGVFVAKSRAGILDEIEEKDANHKKISFITTIRLKFATLMDKIFYGLFYYLSIIIIPVDESIISEKETFFIRWGWFNHLEKKFFKQRSEKTDGYERASELILFKKFPLLYSSEKELEKAEEHLSYRITKKLFKGSRELEEMFLIAEGYIRKEDRMKYDKLLSKEEYISLKKEQGSIDEIRCFNGIDEVLFSFDLIKELIDEEAIKFEKYIRRYALGKTSMGFTRAYKKSFSGLEGDKKIKKMIAELPLPQPIEMEAMKKLDFIERIVKLLEIYFRNVATFYIINEYINLPAGTVVILTKDYTLRMIYETFESEKIVSVTEGKNDGTNDGVNADHLVNMFILAWNYYNHSVENSFKQRTFNILNFRDEGVLKMKENDESETILAKKRIESLQSKPPEKDDTDYSDAIEHLFSETF